MQEKKRPGNHNNYDRLIFQLKFHRSEGIFVENHLVKNIVNIIDVSKVFFYFFFFVRSSSISEKKIMNLQMAF